MIKLICFVKRHPALDRDAFHRHWAEVHGPLIRNEPTLARHLLRYEQNSRLDADYDARPGGFDGVTVQWLEGWDAFRAFVQEPAYPELLAPDEAKLLDREGFGLVFSDECTVQIEGGDAKRDAGAKLMGLVKRHPALDAEQFQDHWAEVHGPLIRDEPTLARHLIGYEQNHRAARDYRHQEPGTKGPDGMVEMWFEGLRGMNAFFREKAYREQIVPDEDTLIDRAGLAAITTGPARVVIE